jgi:peptide chain release factor 1
MIPVGKLESLVRRYAELDQLLCDPKVFGDPQKLNTFNRERSGLSNIVEAFHEWARR